MTNEAMRQQLMEMKLKDLTPDAFDLLFNFAFAKVVAAPASEQPPQKNWSLGKSAAKKGGKKAPKAPKRPPIIEKKPAPTPLSDSIKGPTKSSQAIGILETCPAGLKASELAEALKDEVRLVYPMLSNLKREGKVEHRDGRYFAVAS